MKRVAAVGIATGLVALAAGVAVYANHDEWFTLPKARRLISEKMRDPASAQFRNDRLTANGWHCGEVNAKNGMGGYVGFKRFASDAANSVIYLEGQGMLGDQSTDELVAVLRKATERAEAFNRARDSGAQLERPSREAQLERARLEVFEDHWKAICEQ